MTHYLTPTGWLFMGLLCLAGGMFLAGYEIGRRERQQRRAVERRERRTA